MTLTKKQIEGKLVWSCHAHDHSYINRVADHVLSAYLGGRYQWNLIDSDDMWKIHFGVSAAVVGIELEGRRCCVKLFYDDRLRTKLRTAIGFSKGRRAFRNGLRLQRHGINCPGMIGYAEKRPFGFSLLITELCDEAMRVDHWIQSEGVSRLFVRALAEFIRDMHLKGITHSDLSLRNILVNNNGGRFFFMLLDYEDSRFQQRVTRKQRIDDLHHFNERALKLVSLKEQLLFLKCYLDNHEVKQWARDLRMMIDKNPSKYTRSITG